MSLSQECLSAILDESAEIHLRIRESGSHYP